MTKDRALRVLDVYASVNGSGQCTQDEFEEAKKMAIEALESQDRQVIIAGSYLLEGEDNVPDTNVGDIISRQAAIAELNEIAKMKHAILDSLNISDRRARDMIEAELGQINDDIDSIKDMPSAVFCKYAYRCKQMEKYFSAGNIDVVRCKDCKWWDNEDGAERCTHKYCSMWAKPDGYCSYGERVKE